MLCPLLLGSAGCASGGGGTANEPDAGIADLVEDVQGSEIGEDTDPSDLPATSDAVTDTPAPADTWDVAQDTLGDDTLEDSATEDGTLEDSLFETVDATTELPPIEDVVEVEDLGPPEEPAPVLNEIGCYGDEFIELVNTAQEAPADLSGHILSDGAGPAHNYVLPFGTVVPPQGRLVILEKSDETVGFPFGMQCGGDTVTLIDPEGEVVDQVELPLIMKGNTAARLPDGTGPWEEGLATPGEANQPKTDIEGILFDPTQVISIDLELPQASVDALWAQPDVYAAGMFSMSSGAFEQAPMPIGVRIKGGTPTQTLDGKPGLKLKFNFSDPDQRLMGLKKLTLNNLYDDPSMIREVLSYELFRAASVPSPRTGYAAVTINGEAYGVYLVLEAWDDVSISMFFATLKHLYEGEAGVDVIPSQVSLFDVDEGSTSNTTDLSMLAIVANGTADESWVAAMEDVADLPEFLRMWAVEHHIGHVGGYSITPTSYYLHSDSAKIFSMLPSGADDAFVEHADFHGGAAALFAQCMGIQECLDSYDLALLDLTYVLDAMDLVATAELLAANLAPWAATDPRTPYTVEEVGIAVTATLDYIDLRRTELGEALPEWLLP